MLILRGEGVYPPLLKPSGGIIQTINILVLNFTNKGSLTTTKIIKIKNFHTIFMLLFETFYRLFCVTSVIKINIRTQAIDKVALL